MKEAFLVLESAADAARVVSAAQVHVNAEVTLAEIAKAMDRRHLWRVESLSRTTTGLPIHRIESSLNRDLVFSVAAAQARQGGRLALHRRGAADCHQEWIFITRDDDSVEVYLHGHPDVDLCLDMDTGKKHLQLWHGNGGTNQRWFLVNEIS